MSKSAVGHGSRGKTAPTIGGRHVVNMKHKASHENSHSATLSICDFFRCILYFKELKDMGRHSNMHTILQIDQIQLLISMLSVMHIFHFV